MLQIDPLKRPPNAELELAGSKASQIGHFNSSACRGKSTLSRALFAEDTLAMINCLQAFGIDIKHDHTTATIAINGSGENSKRRKRNSGFGRVEPLHDLFFHYLLSLRHLLK
ncbi:MAG: hypothetical protein CM15mP49_07820 [Actinomycetota bacterium]|nr:MAG: hypothetical protein CM15mP49_07820 [Actinomycetota bacterium]